MQHTSGNKQAEQQADQDTQKKLEEIKRIEKESGSKVVDDLIHAVVDVNPQVPDKVSQPVV